MYDLQVERHGITVNVMAWLWCQSLSDIVWLTSRKAWYNCKCNGMTLMSNLNSDFSFSSPSSSSVDVESVYK